MFTFIFHLFVLEKLSLFLKRHFTSQQMKFELQKIFGYLLNFTVNPLTNFHTQRIFSAQFDGEKNYVKMKSTVNKRILRIFFFELLFLYSLCLFNFKPNINRTIEEKWRKISSTKHLKSIYNLLDGNSLLFHVYKGNWRRKEFELDWEVSFLENFDFFWKLYANWLL